MAPKKGAPAGNDRARKSDEQFFLPFTWATCEKAAESETDLKELRVQYRKLYTAVRGLNAGGRKHKAEEFLQTLKTKIGDAARRLGRYTTKSEAIDDAAAEVDAGEEEHTAIKAEMNRKLRQITSAIMDFEKLLARSVDCFDRRGTAARNAIQAAVGLQYGDPDEELPETTQADGLQLQDGDPDRELSDELDLQGGCKRTARKRSAAELGEPTEQSKRREFKKQRVDELRRLLKEAGEDSAGKKTELVERLVSARTAAAAAAVPLERGADDGVASELAQAASAYDTTGTPVSSQPEPAHAADAAHVESLKKVLMLCSVKLLCIILFMSTFVFICLNL